jgi:SH3 domain
MRVDHAFDAESDSEISIQPGELISVLEEVDAGWFIGEIVGDEARRTGMFPSTYCTLVEMAGRRPPKPPSPGGKSDSSSVDLEEQVSQLSVRRSSLIIRPVVGRSQTVGGTVSPTPSNIAMAKKKAPPPPPVSRGSKPSPVGGATEGKCRECGCVEFRANVFKRGSCNNCFHVHGPL